MPIDTIAARWMPLDRWFHNVMDGPFPERRD